VNAFVLSLAQTDKSAAAAIMKHAPRVRCFAIASADLAHLNSERATRNLPRAKRRQAARNEYTRWKRAIDSIIEDAKTTPYETTIKRLNSLPLDSVNLTFDAESADETIDRMARTIQLRPTLGIGVWEQFVSDDLVFVWLWNDK
jgi:hypothetical protein